MTKNTLGAKMMELSHSLTLNEEALQQITENKRPIFVFEWLRFLDKVLVAAQKNDIKGCQKQLVSQLLEQINSSPGPPTRRLLASCLATVFRVGDTFLLFDTVNSCNDILRKRDDSPSYMPTRLAAICCLGAMYEHLGRLMGRSYEETVSLLLKGLRNIESQGRIETMIMLGKLVAGMGSAASALHKDIYKAVKHCLTDRNMAARQAALQCLKMMAPHASFLWSSELESVCSACFRALDGSNYDTRCAVANLVADLLARSQTQQPQRGNSGKPQKIISLEDALGILLAGFHRGGSSFLKGPRADMIKGSPAVSRELRIGITQVYVLFCELMGNVWLERNLATVIGCVLELPAPGGGKAMTSHTEAVYARKCVAWILRSVLGRMLGEKAQMTACKHLITIIATHINMVDINGENAKENLGSAESLNSQHQLICALQELSSLLQGLGTICVSLVQDTQLKLVDVVMSVLLYPSPGVRLGAAWCLRTLTTAYPAQLTPCIDKCTERLESLRSSPEAVSGYSSALAALLGGARNTPLGIPHTRGKIIFNIGEELLRSASQNSRLSLQRTQSGWLLIGAVSTLGIGVIRGLLPRMLLLWRNSFPRSSKELESEKARGDAFTWQVTLEGRAGALASVYSFLLYCSELATDDVIRRLLTPIESAIVMLANIQSVVRSYSQHLKAAAAMVRLRLYQALSLLPPVAFEGSHTHLFRLVVAEFTLTESQGNTSTSLLVQSCNASAKTLLGAWLADTAHEKLEDQMEPGRKRNVEHLQPNSASGSGALEHDPTCLYSNPSDQTPGPLPLGVLVIDNAVGLFGLLWGRAANKHKQQMLEHFPDCIKQAKAARQEAIQLNVFTALLLAFKHMADTKMNLQGDEVRQAAASLLLGAINVSNPTLRCAVGEGLGRLAQIVGDSRFVAELAQSSFDKLRVARDAVSRTGHSLALGCLHHYVGSMGSGQHLNTSVSVLLALAQDLTSPMVQVWSLNALTLIAESGGPLFRGYVEPALSLSLQLLLSVSPSYPDVHYCIARLLQALITTVGPELQANSSSMMSTRCMFLCGCAAMQLHPDHLVQAEATGCLQQLHMFAPRHVNLNSLVPNLCKSLSSDHLILRKAAMACLRQLAQREAKEVCEQATGLNGRISRDSPLELAAALFGLLDMETDPRMVDDTRHTLQYLLHSLVEESLPEWLQLCGEVLTTASDSSFQSNEDSRSEAEQDVDEGNDEEQFHTGEDTCTHPPVQPRWPTRVFAAQCVQNIITICTESSEFHLDLLRARDTSKQGDFVVSHLGELVRMGFMAATSYCDQLRLEGLKTLQLVIDKFNNAQEPEFPGHLLLEQYQAQVGAALRPAFSQETPPHVTAIACQVCSAWIGSGVARDLNDLRRVHQLLVSSLSKLKRGPAWHGYNESASTLEKLAILKAWAEVYIVSVTTPKVKILEEDDDVPKKDEEDDSNGEENLLKLVSSELGSLSKHWLAALKDHALLSLPSEFSSQLPHDGGAFYTHSTLEAARPHYKEAWPSLLQAAALWLHNGGFKNVHKERSDLDVKDSENLGLGPANAAANKSPHQINSDRFHLIFGLCMEALCSSRAGEPLSNMLTCMQALRTLLDSPWPRSKLTPTLAIELCNVLHRLLLTRENATSQLLVMDVIQLVIVAAEEALQVAQKQKRKELIPANQDSSEACPEVDLLGEGGESGELVPGKSLVFAILEVCLCVLIRQLPSLTPSLSGTAAAVMRGSASQLSPDGAKLVGKSVQVMTSLPSLTSPQGSVAILPTILYLTLGVLRETAIKPKMGEASSSASSAPVAESLRCLKTLSAHRYTKDKRCNKMWEKVLLSSLAKLLDLAKTTEEDWEVCETSVLLGMCTLIVHSPQSVCANPHVLYPAINQLQQYMQSTDIQVRIKCVQSLRSIFSGTSDKVCVSFIQCFAPRIVQWLYTPEAREPKDQISVTYVWECVQTLDSLVGMASPDHRSEMLGLLVGALITFLKDAPANMTQESAALHELSLGKLVTLGPQYPSEFRSLVVANPSLRTRLEAALKAKEKRQKSSRPAHVNSSSNPSNAQPKTPTITLKTDFSNFR